MRWKGNVKGKQDSSRSNGSHTGRAGMAEVGADMDENENKLKVFARIFNPWAPSQSYAARHLPLSLPARE